MQQLRNIATLALLALFASCSTPNNMINDLETTWVLQSIGGEMLDSADYERGLPTLEIRLDEKRAFGFGGCNQYSGDVIIDDQKITFSQVISTRMACIGTDIERRYFKVISDKTLQWRLKGGMLYMGSGNELLVFGEM